MTLQEARRAAGGVLSILCGLWAHSALAFSGGAPICDVMPDYSNISVHITANLMANAGPYEIAFDAASYTPGSPVEVTLEGGSFIGFLLVAVDDAGLRTGTWSPVSPQAQASSFCAGEALTHTAASALSSVTGSFTPPASASGAIAIEAYVFALEPGPTLYRLVGDDGSAGVLPLSQPSVPALGPLAAALAALLVLPLARGALAAQRGRRGASME